MSIDSKAMTVNEFCKAHKISKGLFYKLQKSGKGPKTMVLGRKRLITEEAAQNWRKSNEG